MADHERLIRATWRALGGAEATVELLLARHREPHRRYHTVRHVGSVISTVDELLAVHRVEHPGAVRVAALFHDVVHDPRASDNEARSADMAAGAAFDLGWDTDSCAVVHRLVMATATHHAHDPAEAVLVDADLGVLAAAPAVYADYAHGVRQEYAHVDDAAWRVGRAAVLQSFLDRDHIYATETMRHRAERRARANLSAELADLVR